MLFPEEAMTRPFRKSLTLMSLIAGLGCFPAWAAKPLEVTIVLSPKATPRVVYGGDRLKDVLTKVGAAVSVGTQAAVPARRAILIGFGAEDALLKATFTKTPLTVPKGPEAFLISSALGKARIAIWGGDDSGALYGCLELAGRIQREGKLPKQINLMDEPKLHLRGTNLFWMKQGDYDWAVTPENFPWFFDRALMTRYLDTLVENRFNSIYFWNGHPFSYFLRLPKYPEAQSLSGQELERNIEYFKWFTAEADKRGIWVIFHFYNIHVPKTFAEAHKAEGVHVANEEATPLLASYTRYAISEFIRNYPSVGLLVCAGEALEVKKEEWVRDVIIPAVKDAGKEPPIIVREWTIDRDRFKEIVVPAYQNLYTMMKHNVEMIVSPHPDPRNEAWTKIGHQHLVNLHEVADVKPLRWGSPVLLQEMIRHWREMGIAGIHVYPMVSWGWPYTEDRTEPRLLTLDRDWIWFEAIGRYGWNPDRDEVQEKEYWIGRLQEKFGAREAAEHLLAFYETTGPVLPGLQNLMSIFNMNWNPTIVAREQVLDAMLNSDRQNGLDNPLSRPLDRLTLARYAMKFGGNPEDLGKQPPLSVKEYVLKEMSGGEVLRRRITPPQLLDVFQAATAEGGAHAREAARTATRNKDEAGRFGADAEILQEITGFYRHKIDAAISKGRYDRDHHPEDLQAMMASLEKSVSDYRRFMAKADSQYLQATDMTRYLNWDIAIKAFEGELGFYRNEIERQKAGQADVLFLGVNGPFADFTNAFHRAVADAAKVRGLTTSSYLIKPEMIDRARLILIYSLADPFVEANRARLLSWIERGGRLLIWDEQARAFDSNGLLEGLSFNGPSDERVLIRGNPRSIELRFSSTDNPLIGSLKGMKLDKSAPAIIPNSVRDFSPEWQSLAYTVVSNKDYGGLFNDPPGPTYVVRADPRTCPLVLEKSLRSGKVALLQLGRWQVREESHRKFTATLASNIFDWAKH
jgi:hypothetical protein